MRIGNPLPLYPPQTIAGGATARPAAEKVKLVQGPEPLPQARAADGKRPEEAAERRVRESTARSAEIDMILLRRYSQDPDALSDAERAHVENVLTAQNLIANRGEGHDARFQAIVGYALRLKAPIRAASPAYAQTPQTRVPAPISEAAGFEMEESGLEIEL